MGRCEAPGVPPQAFGLGETTGRSMPSVGHCGQTTHLMNPVSTSVSTPAGHPSAVSQRIL
jgi:hypothetical protein